MKILITGGSGFIGSTLCRRLLKAGHEVYTLDTIPSKVDKVNSIIGDITDSKIKDYNFWVGIDVCYHLAAMANVDDCREFKDKAFFVNLYGTFNVAEACRRYGILMIFASTACVYGNSPQHPSTEDGPTNPMDLYGVTKRAGEEIVKLLPRWIILRFGTTVGPEMRPALATWIFLNQAHNNQPFTITGDGTQSRNWIYIDDLVEGCCKALESTDALNNIINLVGRKSYTVYEMAKLCDRVINGKDKTVGFLFLPAREGDVNKEDISIDKARRILHWYPKIDLKEALRRSYKEGFK